VTRPSSYGDCFHQRNRTPAHPNYTKKMFPIVPGGWQSVMTETLSWKQPLWQYDLRSAYLWSLAQGLPDPSSFRRVKRFDGPGVYWCRRRKGSPIPGTGRGFIPRPARRLRRSGFRTWGRGLPFGRGHLTPGGMLAIFSHGDQSLSPSLAPTGAVGRTVPGRMSRRLTRVVWSKPIGSYVTPRTLPFGRS
jgi:hypothetical protein